jgi:hypothetical protein
MDLLKEAADTSSEFSTYEIATPLHNLNESVSANILSILQRANLFRPFARAVTEVLDNGTIDNTLLENVGKTVWQETIKAANGNSKSEKSGIGVSAK